MEQSNSLLIGLNDEKKKIFADECCSTFLLAPHGSGKSVAFIIPNLLIYKDSMIVHDVKGEAHLMTSDYRKAMGHNIILWKPLCEEMSGNRMNPFDFINSDDTKKAFSDLQKLIALLIPNDCEDECKNFTDARQLLIALIFHYLLVLKKKVSLGMLARLIFGNFRQEIDSFKNNDSNDEISSIIKNIFVAFIKKAEKKQDKIISVLKDHLELYLNPFIDYATSESDFKVEDLYAGKTTIYVSIQPTYMNFLQPVLRFFYDHLFYSLMKFNHCDGSKNKSNVCFILDEFHSLGRLQLLESIMPYFRGYKIHTLLIANTMSESEMVYGAEGFNDLLSLCHHKIFFKPFDMYSALDIVRECTVELEDLMSLTAEQQIINVDMTENRKVTKCSYYNDSVMKALVKQIIC